MSKLEIRGPVCSEREISELLEPFGLVKAVSKINSSSYVVEMEDARDAKAAQEKLDRQTWKGVTTQVQFQPQPNKPKPPPPRRLDSALDKPLQANFVNNNRNNPNTSRSANNSNYNNSNSGNSNLRHSGGERDYRGSNNRDSNYNRDRPQSKEKMFNFDSQLITNYNVRPATKPQFSATFPSPSKELERYKVISNLYEYYCSEVTYRFNIQPPEDAFVRWIIEQYSIPLGDQDDFNDPVLPAVKRISRSEVVHREVLKSLPQSLHLSWFQRSKPLQKTLDLFNSYISAGLKAAKEFDASAFRFELSDTEWIGEDFNRLEELQVSCLDCLKKVSSELPKSFHHLGIDLIDKLMKQLNEHCVPFFKIIFTPTVSRFIGAFTEKAEESISLIKNFAYESGDRNAPTVTSRNGIVTLQFGKDYHEISEMYYQKFQKLYAIHSGEIDPNNQHFHSVLYCLIRRHETCFGKANKGSGFQASAPSSVWETLIARFGVTHESFASPLNCYLPQFCSAFPDIDIYFGSKGSFFDFWPTEGSFQLGTPNVEEVLIKAAYKVNQLLDESTGPMSWICLVPDWSNPPSLFLSIYGESKYLKNKYLVPGKSYSYNRGDSHTPTGQNNSNFAFLAPFGSWIYILQNDAGYEKWPANEENMGYLIDAFNSSKC